MNHRHALAMFALALGLAGCASYPSNPYAQLSYQNGSYYSAGADGYGDYYFAPEPRYGYYDYFGFYDHSLYYGAYGSPFYPFDSYCPARYRYCPPFGYSPFLDPYHRFGFNISFGSYGWYDPYRGPYPWPYSRQSRHHDHPGMGQATAPSGAEVADAAEPEQSGLGQGSVGRRPNRPTTGEPVRQRQPAPRREEPEPEPQTRRSESSDSTPSSQSSNRDQGGRRRSNGSGDDH